MFVFDKIIFILVFNFWFFRLFYKNEFERNNKDKKEFEVINNLWNNVIYYVVSLGSI